MTSPLTEVRGNRTVEHEFNPVLAHSYGVDVDNLIINQPSTGEEALDVAEALARTGQFGVVVIDSVSALLPTAEAENDMSQNSIGLQARLMSKSLRKLTPVASEGECTVIFINQIREKIGVMYGNPETTSGGRALSFYSSIRIEVRQNGGKDGQLKNAAGDVIGHQVKCKIVKNRTAAPYKEAVFNLYYGKGIDSIAEIIDIAITTGMIKQGGAWFTYKTEGDDDYFKIQGKDRVFDHVMANSALREELEHTIRTGVDHHGEEPRE